MINRLVFNQAMEIFRTRRSRLKALINDRYDGNQSRFARETSIKAPQINRWLSEQATDSRNITESSARKIEEAAGIKPGWLDGVDSLATRLEANSNPTGYQITAEAIPKRQRQIDEIVSLLEKTDDYGIVAMLEKAKDVARDYPITKQRPASST